MTAAPPFDLLRQAVSDCRDSDKPSLRWIGGALKEYLNRRRHGDRVSLDEMLGLECSAQDRLSFRDDRIRECHRKHFATIGLPKAAKEIAKIARRLRRTADLNVDRLRPDDPVRPIAEALTTGTRFPQERQLINILGGAVHGLQFHQIRGDDHLPKPNAW